ncbi:MAG TPA: TrkA family potassium uptake protein [Treponemataceae bacterium]|nr:TrkA family potassium uptake protein [Treponemataceae bacterium]
MEKTYAVLGLGSFGRQICLTLMEKGVTVIAIDNNQLLVDSVRDQVTKAIVADVTDEASLKSLMLGDVDGAIVAIGDNVEASILATTILKELNVPYIAARAISVLHERVLKKIGADVVLNLELESGMRLARKLAAPDILDRIPITSYLSLVEAFLPFPFIDYSVEKLRLRETYHIQLVLVRRPELSIDELGNPQRTESHLFPDTSLVLAKGDVLLLLGSEKDIEEFIQEGISK